MYLLGIKGKRLFDETFDKMQLLGRLKYITSHIFFNFSVFLVYKTIAKRERKRCAIVDIQKLNDLVILDAYSLLWQSDIITSV